MLEYTFYFIHWFYLLLFNIETYDIESILYSFNCMVDTLRVYLKQQTDAFYVYISYMYYVNNVNFLSERELVSQ